MPRIFHPPSSGRKILENKGGSRIPSKLGICLQDPAGASRKKGEMPVRSLMKDSWFAQADRSGGTAQRRRRGLARCRQNGRGRANLPCLRRFALGKNRTFLPSACCKRHATEQPDPSRAYPQRARGSSPCRWSCRRTAWRSPTRNGRPGNCPQPRGPRWARGFRH